MENQSYKQYLNLLKEKPQSATFFSKVILFISIVMFLTLGIGAAAVYKFQKEAPQLAKYQYLEAATTDFSGAINSVNDILSSFKVAGDKIEIVDAQKEATHTAAQSAFYVSLDDVERLLSKIETTNQNLQNKKASLGQKVVPEDLKNLAEQVNTFYDQSSQTLEDIHKDQLFAKQLLIASGPKFYVPTLTDETMWDRKDKQEIITYYKATKEEANTSLASLSKLPPSAFFADYYSAQIDYLTLLVKLSDDILNTLAVADDSDPEAATQLEKAYQMLVTAKAQNAQNEQKLLAQKLKFVDVSHNLERLTPVEQQGNSIQVALKNAFETTPKVEPPSYYLQNIREKFAATFKLGSLQLPTDI